MVSEGRPGFILPCDGSHRMTRLAGSSGCLTQCPASYSRLAAIFYKKLLHYKNVFMFYKRYLTSIFFLIQHESFFLSEIIHFSECLKHVLCTLYVLYTKQVF